MSLTSTIVKRGIREGKRLKGKGSEEGNEGIKGKEGKHLKLTGTEESNNSIKGKKKRVNNKRNGDICGEMKKDVNKERKRDTNEERTGGINKERKRDISELHQRLAFLCQDLRNFSSNKDAAERLNSSVYFYFIGPPYLSSDDIDFVLSSPLEIWHGLSSSIDTDDSQRRSKQKLSKFLEKRMADLVAARNAKQELQNNGGRDFVLCTSHDLAPILQDACSLQKEYFETKAFKDAYKRWEKDTRKAKNTKK